jgi:chemotaxis protein CheD
MTERELQLRAEASERRDLPEAPPKHTIYLHPGRLAVSERPEVVLTILGSCVAVCVWDVRRRIGGMSHFLLPYRTSDGTPRVAGAAVSQLIADLIALGCARGNLRAKLVGGANVLCNRGSSGSTLGEKNFALARELLGEEGVPILAEHVGGNRGRRLVFETSTGSAWVRLL